MSLRDAARLDSFYVAWRYLSFNWARSLTLVTGVTLIAVLPLSLEQLLDESERQLLARAETTPLVAGAKGSSLDLVMSSPHFGDTVPELISMAAADRVADTDLAVVTFPAPPDVAPAFWMPGAETIAAYQAADLIQLNGADYAKWTAKVSLPRSRTVDTSRALKDAYIRASDGVSHSHGPGGEHEHGGVAFTTWLDLGQAAQQAEAVAQALIRKRPNAREQIDRNLQSLQRDLLQLDARIAEYTRTDPGRPLLASHLVYQYLARRYGLNLRSVMWEPEEAPSENQWNELEGILREHPARWMLWEGEPAEETAERLRSLGVESVLFNPCANRPPAGDLLTLMTENTRSLHPIFGQGSRYP